MASTTVALPQTANSIPVEMHNLPGQLRVRQILCVVLTMLVAFVGLLTYQNYQYVVQTIGKDSVPSIVAAEKIRTTLANAHTQIVNVFLTGENENGANAQAYKQSIAQVHDALLVAAQNITYGDEERRPILTLMTQLAEYEQLVGEAIAAKDHTSLLLRADSLMREHILPAAVALDDANFKHLASAYSDGEHIARLYLYGFLLLAVCLTLLLLETQIRLYKKFKRLLNPAMILGSSVLLICVVAFAVKAEHIFSDIRIAKEDAFDSVHALSQAQAQAYTANAQESVYLLTSSQDTQHQQTALFQKTAKYLFASDTAVIGQLPADLKTLQGKGLLGDELANITFVGEEKAARETLANWFAYMRIDAEIRKLESAGKHLEAVTLCLGAQPGQSDWAFEKFINSLTITLNINQAEFDKAIAKAFKEISWLWMLLIPILLMPILGSVIGIQQRLAEFRE